MPVLIGAAVLVGGANLAAYAANGQPLLLGHSNSESKAATVTNTGNGPALSLSTDKNSPPLSVTSSQLVRHLNAATVDGSSAASLQTNVKDYVIAGDGTTAAYNLTALKPGHYVVNVDLGVDATTGTQPFCLLIDPNTSALLASFQNVSASGIAILSGSSTITWNGGSQPLLVDCVGGAIYQSFAGSLPNTVSFTRIGQMVTGTPAPDTTHAASGRNSVGQ
jgi:hypothetical protein